MREDDIIKAGLGLIAGYFIADFLLPKRAYQGDIPDQSGDQFNFRSNTLPTFVAKQGYVFGQGHGQQRHQWDFMPHSLGPPRRAYQGVLGVDYTLACSDQSVANGAGMCANGTRAVVSPISQPPISAATPTPALVPTSSDSGLPATTTPAATTTTPVPVVTTPTPVVTPPTPVPVVTTPTPVVTPPLGPAPVDVIPHPTFPQHPTSNNPHDWQQWAQQFRQDLREDFRQHLNLNRGRGNEWGRGSGWAFQRSGRHAYQATASTQTGNQAVLLATATPSGVHLDVHGLQPLEPVTVDLNIPLSNVSRTTNLMADSSGHLTHDYNMTRPPGKQYIAAIRVTGQQSKRVGFKSIRI